MQHLISLNPTGGNLGSIAALSLADYDKVTHSRTLRNLVSQIRQTKDRKKAQALKKRLPFRSPHYYAFKDNHRTAANALPEAFLFQTCVDVDDPKMVKPAIERAKVLDKKPGRWRDKLLHMEYSARHKLHIDIRLPLGMNIEQAQRAYCEELGITYDPSCITPERMIYITPADDEIYRPPHWYEVLEGEERQMYVDAWPVAGAALVAVRTPDGQPNGASHTSVLSPSNSTSNGPSGVVADSPSGVRTATRAAPAPSPKAQQSSPKPRFVFDLCREQAGLKDVDINAEGSRHTSLLAILSVGAARLLSEADAMAVVAERMPDFFQEPDCRQLIHDFYAKYHDDSKIMSTVVQRINARAEQLAHAQAKKGNDNSNDKSNGELANDNAPFSLDDAQQEKPKEKHSWETFNFGNLPPGLRESLHGNPPRMFLPILVYLLPLAASYADGVTVRYADNKKHQLNLASIVVGPPASGKSACKDVLMLWLQQMREHDREAMERENDWKEECNRNKGGKEKDPPDPKVCLLNPPINISCAELMKRFRRSQGHHLFSFAEELDTLVKSNRAGSWSEKYDVYRYAFDNGEWGQDYANKNSESGIVNVKYNFSLLGTYGVLKRCFKDDNVENGLSSRIMVAEMPDNSFAPMPVYHDPLDDDLEAIDQAVTKLRNANGFLDTPRLRKALADWVEGVRISASKSDDHVIDEYRKRAAVIGFRCGVIARILEGEESQRVLDFATMIADYTLYEQCHVFGFVIRKLYKQAAAEYERETVNHNIFDDLPATFTLEDLVTLKGNDMSPSGLRTIIYRWKKDGWIEKVGANKWKKTN